jgi:hypothetical protein
MPTFQGSVTEEQLTQLISYIRSLSEGNAATGGQTATPTTQAAQPQAK